MAKPASTSLRDIRPLQAFQRAVRLEDQGRFWQAERLYEAVLQRDARHFGAVYRLALIWLRRNKFDDAVRLFRRAVKIDRKSADAHHYLGFALTAAGRAEEAIRHYEISLAIQPGIPEAHNNFGYSLQVLGRYEDAITQYQQALAIRPSYPEARNNLGNALHLTGRSEAAIAQYREALAIRPSYAEAHLNTGNALRALGRAEEAISHYNKAIALRLDYAEAHNNIGNVLHAAGKSEAAIPHYEKALAIRADYAEAQINLGIALSALGRDEEAIPYFERVFAARPDYFETLGRRDALTLLLVLAGLPGSVCGIDVLKQLEKLTTHGRYEGEDCNSLAGFAWATALDKAARYAEAWEHLVPANQSLFVAGQEELRAAIARQHSSLARLRNNAVPALGIGGKGEGKISLFILGPSRSGKTTLEKLVSTLDGVKGGYENSIVEEIAGRACEIAALPAGTSFEELPPSVHSLCCDLYLEELAKRAGPARIFTNTNPIRIYDADLIAAAFPNVRFLCVKRDITDNLLRIYMARYRTGNIHAYDLAAARDHLLWYHEMMDLLAHKLSGIIRLIRYEEMIAEPSATLRTAAELCGVAVTEKPLPALGDDRKCSMHYKRLMIAQLEASDAAPGHEP